MATHTQKLQIYTCHARVYQVRHYYPQSQRTTYLNTKPWLATNYLRIPSRKPSFIITTMTTTPNKSDLPVYDFSTTPEQRAAEQAKIDAAIQVAQLEASLKKQEAPAVKAVKSKQRV